MDLPDEWCQILENLHLEKLNAQETVIRGVKDFSFFFAPKTDSQLEPHSWIKEYCGECTYQEQEDRLHELEFQRDPFAKFKNLVHEVAQAEGDTWSNKWRNFWCTSLILIEWFTSNGGELNESISLQKSGFISQTKQSQPAPN
jgi:hypothetical protein